jgi:hydrogenase expression/formation protein HypC
MCLGIPGQVVEFVKSHEHLAKINVSGVGRVVNIGLLEDEHLQIGDWVLIHVGFALSKIDEREAQLALASLQLMGQAYDDELEAFWESRIISERTISYDASANQPAPKQSVIIQSFTSQPDENPVRQA